MTELSRFFYYKPVELKKILIGFSDLKEIMEAPKDAFLNLGIAGKALDGFLENRNNFFPAIPALGQAEKAAGILQTQEEIKIVTILDPDYPSALKNIYDPPPIIFYKGDLSCLGGATLAVIGSRKITEYGYRVCEALVSDLCKKFIIVSGLAYGVDGLSHEITVKNFGKTIGVLGSGLDEASIYPKSNINLANKILECGGLLLSEVPPGVGPQKFHFPMRNRIIAGISQGILIVEGGRKSGTLITARLGLDSGVDIFAVPGSIFSPSSEGVNFLIKCGAHPVVEAKDIFEFYGVEAEMKKDYLPKNEKEKNILEFLSDGERHVNEIVQEIGEGIMEIMEILTDLEMSEAIKNLGNGKFVKK